MDGPLRVLHVVVNMNRGGAETLIMNLYRNIDLSKVQFDFLTCKQGVFDKEIIELGGEVHRIPYVTDVGHFGYVKALNTFFQSHPKYKIVHSHMDKMSGLVLRSAKKAGIPIRIAHSHSTSSEGRKGSKVYKSYSGRFVLSTATHLIACSKPAARWLFENKADTAMILKNAIELDKFVFDQSTRELIRKELKLTQESFIVGHVGRFNHPKNHTFLIDIFIEITKLKPNAILILAGDGILRPSIERKVESLKLLDKVRFLGVQSDIHRLLQSVDVFLFPSLHEGFGIVVLEAQAAGLPCLISDVITKEIDMEAGLVNFESLNSSATVWAQRAVNTGIRMDSVGDYIKKKGYDIRDTANWIENFYMSVSEEYDKSAYPLEI